LDDQWVNDRECLIRIEAEDSEDEGVVTVLHFAKVEKTNFGTGEEVLVKLPSGVDINLMPRSTSSPRNDEEFILFLKALIRVAVAAEK
jgi:hypothetical protein